MKRRALILFALLACALTAIAAEDPAGNWKASIETPNGTQVQTFALKNDAGKVTGTVVSDMMGSLPISDGKIDGGKISFAVTTDFGAIRYAGTITGDTMKLTITVGDGQFTFDITASRVKT